MNKENNNNDRIREEDVNGHGVFNQIYFEAELRKVIETDPCLISYFIETKMKEEAEVAENGVYDQLRHEKNIIEAMTKTMEKNPELFSDVKKADHLTNEELMENEDFKKGFEKVVNEAPFYAGTFDKDDSEA